MSDRVDTTQWSGQGPQGARGAPHGMARRGPRGRPLIGLMLHHRAELGLSAAQVADLENLRGNFVRDAIRRRADQRIARLDLMALLRRDPTDPAKAVDMAPVEAKIREIEKMRADLQVARIRTVEAGKALLTPDQRGRLTGLLAQPRWPRRGSEQPAPSRS